jgi:glycosyltransferase involved in cell wall biosynthesis
MLRAGLQRAGVEFVQIEAPAADTRLAAKVALGAGLVWRPSSYRLLRNETSRLEADVVHFHNLMPALTPAALAGAKRAGAVIVMTLHNYRLFCPGGTLMWGERIHDACITGSSLRCALHNPRSAWGESLLYGLAIEVQRRLKLVERFVDAFVCPSQYLADACIRAGLPAKRMHVIPTGVPVELRVQSRGRYALYAGRLTAEKGVASLIAAAVRTPDVPVVIAGDGPMRAAVADAATDGHVRYVGVLPADEVRALRDEAAFLVAPSEWPDILPLAIIEALAEGLPVLTTPVGGLKEIAAGGGCRTVPMRDPEALSAALRSMWTEATATDTLQTEAVAAARANFDIDARTRELIDLYETLS